MAWPPTCKVITIFSNISQVSEICGGAGYFLGAPETRKELLKITIIETFFLPVYLHMSYLRPFLKELLPEIK